MSYLKNWRKYRAEAEAIATGKDTDSEFSSSDDRWDSCTVSTNNIRPNNVSTDNSEGQNLGESKVMSTGSSDENSDFLDSNNETSCHFGDSDESVNECQPQVLERDLAAWATKNKCTRSALNELLVILRKQGHRLPKDARALLHTPRTVEIVEKCGGKYLYLGLETGLLKLVCQNIDFFKEIEQIQVTFNIDGVPLFKSTNVQVWPILCSVKNFALFIVAIFCGNQKPNPLDEYLNELLSELKDLMQNGLYAIEKQYRVSVFAFVCDAPARSFLKCTKGQTAYYSCERCVARGTWNGRVVFNSEFDAAPRTDERFQNFDYDIHQIKKIPLIDIGLPCVTMFSLDYMHLVCLGVTKRILTFLKQGPRECKLSYQQLTILSEKMTSLNGKMPREFARQSGSLDYVDKSKSNRISSIFTVHRTCGFEIRCFCRYLSFSFIVSCFVISFEF